MELPTWSFKPRAVPLGVKEQADRSGMGEIEEIVQVFREVVRSRRSPSIEGKAED